MQIQGTYVYLRVSAYEINLKKKKSDPMNKLEMFPRSNLYEYVGAWARKKKQQQLEQNNNSSKQQMNNQSNRKKNVYGVIIVVNEERNSNKQPDK